MYNQDTWGFVLPLSAAANSGCCLFHPTKKKRSGPGPLMFMFLRRRGENVSTKHNLLSLLFITKLSQLIKKDWIGTFVFFWLITIAFSIVVIENQ